MKPFVRCALIGVVITVAAIAPSRAVSASARGLRYLMGTWCELSVWTSDDRIVSPLDIQIEAAFQEIARLEQVLSNWDTTSEVSRLNRAAGQGPQPVSRDLESVVAQAQEICTASGGAFDATVGSAVHLWGFDTDAPRLPRLTDRQDARARIGCGRVTIDRDLHSLSLAAETRLDLGGIGKGYAVDRAMDVLRAHGVTRAKLDFGSSSIGFLGHIEGGWPVVVADPRDRTQALLTFRIQGGSVSSSGQHEHAIIDRGRRYGHIFDPSTGAPVDSPLLVVTVVAPTATAADALSTALFVMGVERSRDLLSRMPDVSAVFVGRRRGGHIDVTTIGPLRDRISLLTPGTRATTNSRSAPATDDGR